MTISHAFSVDHYPRSSPDQLMQPDCDRVELSNGVTEKILVLCNSRVALNKALGQVVDKKTEGVVN